MRALVLAAAAVLLLGGCTAAYDDDGDGVFAQGGAVAAVPPDDPDAVPIVVDTDLAPDDLVALAFLVERSDVRVEAVTVAGTGLVGCDPGADLVADLMRSLRQSWVHVACGREDPARPWPAAWRAGAAAATGLPRHETTIVPVEPSAPDLIADLARRVDGLQVVALGPLTNLADLASSRPQDYARLAHIQSMAGAVDSPDVDGVAEWNAAADPEALATVLRGPVPLTLVPDDPVPDGTPAALAAPVVGGIAAAAETPRWWDLATVAAFVAPGLGTTETGGWEVDESGRLSRTGRGPVAVVTSLDPDGLDAVYAATFSGSP